MTKIFTQSALLGFSHKKYLVNPAIVCSSTSAPISSRCASLPGRKTRPVTRASPRPFCPLSLRSLRSLRFNRRRILSCALRLLSPVKGVDVSRGLHGLHGGPGKKDLNFSTPFHKYD